MNVQKAVEIAKEGVIKDVAKMWIEQGYTPEDFEVLKNHITKAVVEYEDKCKKFNAKSDERSRRGKL